MSLPAGWPATSRCRWLLVLCLAPLLNAPWAAHGQGLRQDLQAVAPSGTTFSTFRQACKASTAWRDAMRTSTESACSVARGSLCSSSSEQAALLLATAPQTYDARSSFSNVAVMGPVKDQGECGMSVAFAVLAAAQTAAAVALRQSFKDATLSEQDFFMCRTADPLRTRGCSSKWSLQEGMLAFVQLQQRNQLPVVEACRRYEPLSRDPCSCTCTTTLLQLLQGSYMAKSLGSIVEMQRHIRQQGSIVCRMQLYSDITPFFATNPGGVYKGPGKRATMDDAHAVQVVGYDNSRQAWLIKNSWGPGFGTKGFAWVAFDAPGMCDRQDTYGFVFAPSQPQPADQLRLAPAPGRKGCYTYRAVAGDYPEGVASRAGVPVQRLLLDNLGVIKGDPSTLPAGTTLLLCGVSPEVVAAAAAASGGPGGAPAAGDEVAALLAIKAVLDPAGTALVDWRPGSPTPCSWTGVTCDAGSKRVGAIDLGWDAAGKPAKVQLSGQLPSGALLRRLPALVVIGLGSTGLSGPLPEDWSQLRQLEEVYLMSNQLTGTLPPSWGALSKLRVCSLSANSLRGPLPATWSGMGVLDWLDLARNSLTGTLPPSWGALSKLRVFRLYDNRLSGPLPATWSGMGALEELELTKNALTGTLPPSWGALSKLRVCRLFTNRLSGPLPATWSRMGALEELGLGVNTLTGTLPPAWSALSKLRVCKLYTNRLSGPLPATWSRMGALEELALATNALTSTVPPSWGSWDRVKGVTLWANPQLTGCLPAAWRSKVNAGLVVEVEGPFKGKDLLTAGTNIRGFC